MPGIAEPVVIALVASVAVADVLRLRSSRSDPELSVGRHELVPSPLLLEVRLDERDTRVLLEYAVAVIPSGTIVERRTGRGEPPHPAARCNSAWAGDADALK